MQCAGMGINILNIICVIKFKIVYFIIMPELFQRLDQKGKNKSYTTIIIIIVYLSQVLLDNIHILEYSTFKSFWLPVNKKNCK